MKLIPVIAICVGLLLAGCTYLPGQTPTNAAERTVSPAASAEPSTTPQAAGSALAEATALPDSNLETQYPGAQVTGTEAGVVALQIWVPPQFDPGSGSPAGKLLKARLDEFTERRPDVRLEVRVKSETGMGGIYESLSAATSAAQLAVPDLVALDFAQIQTAAQNGLIRPLDGMTSALDNPDWFDYARKIALVQNSIFGLPFAGDALVQVYQPGDEQQPGTSWMSVLQSVNPLIFPAGDPHALFSLALYQASGGLFVDEGGRPQLQEAPLQKVLRFYQDAESVGVMPDTLVQYHNDDQAWQAYLANPTGSIATWASRYLAESPGQLAIQRIPTLDGKPYTIARGWAWTLASQDSRKRELALQLVEFLTESDFLARWTEAAGYLPPRPSALEGWSNQQIRAELNSILNAATLAPPPEILDSLGLRIQPAVLQVLKNELDADAAAKAVLTTQEAP